MPDDLARRVTVARRDAAFQPSTFDEKALTVELTWTTGASVERVTWFGDRYTEELEVSDTAVDLGRLNAGAPLLDTHGQWDLEDVIGVVDRAWIEDGQGRAVVRFSAREAVADVVRDVKAGIIRNVSVGYMIDEWLITKDEKTGKETRRATRWTPFELSLVPIPADAAAQVRSGRRRNPVSPGATAPNPAPAAPAATEEVRMPDVTPPAAPPPAAPPAIQPPAPVPATLAELRSLTERSKGRLDEKWIVAQLAANATLDAARDLAIDAMATAPVLNPSISAQETRNERETKREAMANALQVRAGVPKVELTEAGREYRGMSLSDMAAECVTWAGGNVRGRFKSEIARAALGNRDMMSRVGMMGNSDFPLLLANTSNKSLRAGYAAARRKFEAYSRKRTMPNFLLHSTVAMSGAPELKRIAEHGEITFGAVSEAGETWQLSRFGRRVAITYIAIVNDDMEGFSRIPQMFGDAASRLESMTVLEIFNSNPLMGDGVALFDAAHANVGTGVLNVTNVGALQALIGAQRGLAPMPGELGDVLDLDGRFLLVPNALEGVAKAFFASSVVPNAPSLNNLNPWLSDFLPIIDRRLTSQLQYYLIADPNQIDTIHYGYLEGEEGPQINSYVDEDTDGVVVKCTHNFAAKAIDWRGMARSTGA